MSPALRASLKNVVPEEKIPHEEEERKREKRKTTMKRGPLRTGKSTGAVSPR